MEWSHIEATLANILILVTLQFGRLHPPLDFESRSYITFYFTQFFDRGKYNLCNRKNAYTARFCMYIL